MGREAHGAELCWGPRGSAVAIADTERARRTSSLPVSKMGKAERPPSQISAARSPRTIMAIGFPSGMRVETLGTSAGLGRNRDLAETGTWRSRLGLWELGRVGSNVSILEQ
jgi:hypothetical protein